MQALPLILKGFRGIRAGLGLDALTLDFERNADGAQLVAICVPDPPSCVRRIGSSLGPGGRYVEPEYWTTGIFDTGIFDDCQ